MIDCFFQELCEFYCNVPAHISVTDVRNMISCFNKNCNRQYENILILRKLFILCFYSFVILAFLWDIQQFHKNRGIHKMNV